MQNFFNHIDSGKMDWMFWVIVAILLVKGLAHWVKWIMSCHVCGSPIMLQVDQWDNNHWFCGKCGWSKDNCLTR